MLFSIFATKKLNRLHATEYCRCSTLIKTNLKNARSLEETKLKKYAE